MKKGQRGIRPAGRHQVAERMAQGERHGDRRLRRRGALRRAASCSTSTPTKQEATRNDGASRRSMRVAGVALVLARSPSRLRPAGAGAAAVRRDAGLSMNRDQPVKIESNTLEVRDKIRQATFIGDVKLTQGDTILKCKTLVVFYEDTAAAPAQKKGAPAQRRAAGAERRRRAGGGAADQARRGEGRRLRHAEGSDRERRQRRVRCQGQHRRR